MNYISQHRQLSSHKSNADAFFTGALIIAIVTCVGLYTFLAFYCWQTISQDCKRNRSRSLELSISNASCVSIHDCPLALSISIVNGSTQLSTAEDTTAVAFGNLEKITNVAIRSQSYNN